MAVDDTDEWDPRSALRASVLDTVRTTAPIGAGLYTLAIAAWAMGWSPSPPALVWSLAAGAFVSMLVALVARRPWFPPEAANALACLLIAQALENTALSFHLMPSAASIVGFVVITLAAPLLFLSLGWVLATIVGSCAVMGVVMAANPGQIPFSVAVLSMVCAGAISVAMVIVRIGSNLRFERIRHDDEIQKRLLDESKERYRSLFEGVPVGIVRMTPEGAFEDGNEAAVRLLGFPHRDAFLRGSVGDIHVDPLERARLRGALYHAGCVQGLEVRGRSFDGRDLWLRITAHTSDHPASRGLVEAVLEDVTARKAAERELDETRRLVARTERLSSLGTLVAGVAHEINNPLTYMRGYSELVQMNVRDLLARSDVPEDAREMLAECDTMTASVLSGITRVAHITSSLKTVARPSTGERKSESPNALVEGVLAVMQSRLKDDVRVVAHLDATREVHVNASGLSQVILNVAFNAADALEGRADGVIRVATREDATAAIIEVQDNGPGIPPWEQAKLFTPFHTTKATGLGLGLAMSHRIMEEHGGTITFESVPGGGTLFRLRIPFADAPPADVPRGNLALGLRVEGIREVAPTGNTGLFE